MDLEREIDLLMQTKTYMTQIAGFGLDYINELDKEFKEGLTRHRDHLKRVGFIKLAGEIDTLLNTKDIKTYLRIEFLLKTLEEEIIKSL